MLVVCPIAKTTMLLSCEFCAIVSDNNLYLLHATNHGLLQSYSMIEYTSILVNVCLKHTAGGQV